MKPLYLLIVGVVVGWAAGGECHAANVTVLPRIPISLPGTLGLGGGQTGGTLGTSLQGSITITDPEPIFDPNPRVQTAFATYSVPLAYSDGADSRESQDGRFINVGNTAGSILSVAVASPGKLRGLATAGGGGGSVNGVATATALFVDTVTIDLSDQYVVDWNVHGIVRGGSELLSGTNLRAAAGGNILAQVWWVPIDVSLAQAVQANFFGSYYQSTSWVFNPGTGETVITKNLIKPDLGEGEVDIREVAGTQFWVVGLLEVTAGRSSPSGTIYQESFLTGDADFMNTVEMTIESLSDPGQSGVTSFSGHDYSPHAVPEPSTVAMLIFGGAALLFRRRMGAFFRPLSPNDGEGTCRIGSSSALPSPRGLQASLSTH